MFIRIILLIFTLGFTTTGFAQDDEKLDAILQLLTDIKSEQAEIKAEQEAQRETIERLQSYHANGADPDTQSPEQQPIPIKKKAIKRKGGWIASVHPVDKRGKKISAMIGKMVIDGFPMKHDIGQEKFKVGNEGIAYRGNGELRIEESGIHSLLVSMDSSVIGTYCQFTFELAGQKLFDIPKINWNDKGVYSSEIDIEEGVYKFKMLQSCTRQNAVWNLQILAPSAMNPVSLGSDDLFHRVRE